MACLYVFTILLNLNSSMVPIEAGLARIFGKRKLLALPAASIIFASARGLKREAGTYVLYATS